MLVITLGGAFQAPIAHGLSYGPFWLVRRMMDLIGVKFTCAHVLVHVDARFTLYHFDLQEYVFLAQHVTRVRCRCLGGADALTDIGRSVDQAAAASS